MDSNIFVKKKCSIETLYRRTRKEREKNENKDMTQVRVDTKRHINKRAQPSSAHITTSLSNIAKVRQSNISFFS